MSSELIRVGGLGAGVVGDLEVLAVEAVESTDDSSNRAEDSSREGVVIRGGEGIRSGDAAGVGLGLGSGVRNDVILEVLEVFLVDFMDSGVPEALWVLLGRWLGEPLADQSFLKFVMEPGGRPGNS